MTQLCLPALRASRGRVVNMGSISGLNALPLLGAYAMSKFALEAMTDSLRVELAPWGIHVAIVEPGTIKTPIWTRERPDPPAEALSLYGARTRRVPQARGEARHERRAAGACRRRRRACADGREAANALPRRPRREAARPRRAPARPAPRPRNRAPRPRRVTPSGHSCLTPNIGCPDMSVRTSPDVGTRHRSGGNRRTVRVCTGHV